MLAFYDAFVHLDSAASKIYGVPSITVSLQTAHTRQRITEYSSPSVFACKACCITLKLILPQSVFTTFLLHHPTLSLVNLYSHASELEIDDVIKQIVD